jgi:hypothetical protein
MQCTRGGLSTAAGEHRHSCPFEVHLRCAFQADSRELWARRCRPVMCSEAGPGRSAPASRRWCFSTVLLVLSGVRTNRWKKGFKFTSLTGLLNGNLTQFGMRDPNRENFVVAQYWPKLIVTYPIQVPWMRLYPPFCTK